MRRVRVQTADFDPGAEIAALSNACPEAGGLGSFLGLVRGVVPDGRRLAALELEHYPGMTESSLAAIADQAIARFGLAGCVVIHRIGRLSPGARIVFVAAASTHRQPALDATSFLIDWLKTAAPFWKREFYDDDTQAWVPAKTTDDEAAAKWTL